MELGEKLQELRKRKGLTQEDLAQQLYVSRTAISKWESGRGIPNMESLKAISKFFDIYFDELLSGEKLFEIVENEYSNKIKSVRDMIFGLLDCGMLLLLFLPFFRQNSDGALQSVSLLALTEIQTYLRTVYFAIVTAMVLIGILTLALQNVSKVIWQKSKTALSLGINMIGVGLFIISQQPYAAIFVFGVLLVKVIMLMKNR